MKSMQRTVAMVAVASILLFTAMDVHAEVFIDLYAGNTKTGDGKADFSSNVGSIPSGDVKYDSSFTVGGRLGAWFGKYFGLGVDVFHFDTNEKDSPVEMGNLAFALDLMARYPFLVGEGMPHGRLQPYVTVGPAIFVSSLEMPGFTEGRSATIGFKGGAGLKFLFTKNIGLFGEYRYTYFEPEHEFQAGPATGNITQRIGSHHFVGGLTIHFN